MGPENESASKGEDLSGLGMAELLERARRLTAELAHRALDPNLLDTLERIPAGPGADRSAQWGLYAHADTPGEAVEPSAADELGAGNESGETLEPSRADDPGTAGGPAERDPAGTPHVPAGSLPMILTGVEELGRWVDAARTGLAGHVDRVFDAHATRREVLGVPEGKCAYRQGADYLWQVLGIHRAEAKRRVVRASRIMGTLSLQQDHVVLPPLRIVGEVVRQAQADPGSVDLVGDALMDARQDAVLGGVAAELIDPLLADGERVLTEFARQSDPVSVKKAVDHWRQRFDALVNPDGVAPSDAQVDAAQGLFYHGRGQANLHRWTVLATDAQHERLKTVVSAASTLRNTPPAPTPTNPAATPTNPAASPGEQVPPDEVGQRQRHVEDPGAAGDPGDSGDSGEVGAADAVDELRAADAVDELGEVDESSADPWRRQLDQADSLDRRSRAQRELDGLVSALTGALALTGVDTTPDSHPPGALPPGATGSREPAARPDTGRLRPQMLVTIDFQTLAQQYERHRSSTGGWEADGVGPPHGPHAPHGASGGPQAVTPGETGRFLSEAAFTGPVDPTMIRQLACEADVIPVVLGGQGEVLDVGRSQRLFSGRLRQAITARDGGCAAPDCSIPAPWCEAHHVQHWQHGGPTSVQNGVLLCSHHHHAVHAAAWEIRVEEGIPWFIPARYQDPEQRPRRNRFWRPGDFEPRGEAA